MGKESKKAIRDEIKRMKASMKQLKKEKTRKPDLNLCMKCKQDAGNNFILIYKKNNELKGKICTSCSKEKLFDLNISSTQNNNLPNNS